jgi:hypothetical protein
MFSRLIFSMSVSFAAICSRRRLKCRSRGSLSLAHAASSRGVGGTCKPRLHPRHFVLEDVVYLPDARLDVSRQRFNPRVGRRLGRRRAFGEECERGAHVREFGGRAPPRC